MQRWKSIAVLCLVVSLSGCAAKTNVTNLPPGVTQSQVQAWNTAVTNLNLIASTVSTARQTVISLNQSGIFPSGAEYNTTLQVLGKIDTLEISAAAILEQTPQNFSATTKQQVQALVTQISQQLLTLNASGVTGIKNPTSLQTVNNLIAGITSAVALILSL